MTKYVVGDLYEMTWRFPDNSRFLDPFLYDLAMSARQYIKIPYSRPDFSLWIDHEGEPISHDDRIIEYPKACLKIRVAHRFVPYVEEQLPTSPLPFGGEKYHLRYDGNVQVEIPYRIVSPFITFKIGKPFAAGKIMAEVDKHFRSVDFPDWGKYVLTEFEDPELICLPVARDQVSYGIPLGFRALPMRHASVLLRFGLGSYRNLGLGIFREKRRSKSD